MFAVIGPAIVIALAELVCVIAFVNVVVVAGIATVFVLVPIITWLETLAIVLTPIAVAPEILFVHTLALFPIMYY